MHPGFTGTNKLLSVEYYNRGVSLSHETFCIEWTGQRRVGCQNQFLVNLPPSSPIQRSNIYQWTLTCATPTKLCKPQIPSCETVMGRGQSVVNVCCNQEPLVSSSIVNVTRAKQCKWTWKALVAALVKRQVQKASDHAVTAVIADLRILCMRQVVLITNFVPT